MSDNTQGTELQPPVFRFEVDFGEGVDHILFQQVSGMDAEVQVPEYRTGHSGTYSPIKMPVLHKGGIVTLKRGVFKNNPAFWTWRDKVTMNTISRATIVIRVFNETGATTYSWTLNNAQPTKLTGTDMQSEGNEIAVESVDIAYG